MHQITDTKSDVCLHLSVGWPQQDTLGTPRGFREVQCSRKKPRESRKDAKEGCSSRCRNRGQNYRGHGLKGSTMEDARCKGQEQAEAFWRGNIYPLCFVAA